MRNTIILTSIAALVCLAAPVAAAQDREGQAKAYIVSNAHLDSQWNWDVQKTTGDYVPKTLYRNLMLLDRYPDYVFNFEGGQKYAWMKEYCPESWEKLKSYIASGRWHISGGGWEASDANVPSPESLTRNILYGQHFYQEEFGVLSTDIFLPDCFGFGQHLPTIAAHCGLIGFSTQKLQWREKPFYADGSKVPFEFGLWKGLDGGTIMMAIDAQGYGARFNGEDLTESQMLKDLAAKAPQNTAYRYYGTGDIGGSPTIESVATIQDAIDRQKAGREGSVHVISAASDQLYKDYMPFSAHPDLPVWEGELTMDVHGTGCYTSEAAMKLFNRRNEQLADAAEHSAVAADWLGRVDYPQATLNEAWKRVIWHQFHDDLTGTSIPRAYEFSWNDEVISLRQFGDVLATSVGAVASELDTKVSGTPVVLYNPSSFPRTEVVAVESGDAKVFDGRGKAVRSQKGKDGKVYFLAEVPAVGYAVYDMRKGNGSSSKSSIKAGGNTIENSVYRIRLNDNGDIASIVDKRCGRELVEQGKAIRLAFFTNNESFKWPAWEVIKTTLDAEPVSVGENVRISVEQSGPVVGALRIERDFQGSHFSQLVCLYDGASEDRIDIINDVEWQSRNALLKAEFPLAVSNPKARYDIGTGSLERGNSTPTQYEVYAQQWADLTAEDGSYGVAVMNDCKYGWDKPADNVIRLTLLHTPKTRNGYWYQQNQDLGHHTFTYSIVGHQGDFRSGDIPRKAEILNQGVKAFTAGKHAGSLGRSFSFASATPGSVAMRALKKAEDSDAYVVRFYETFGQKAQKATVHFAGKIIEAKELNGNEQVIGAASSEGNDLSFEISPFGIKTFLVKLENGNGKLGELKSAPIELPYHFKAASYNPFRIEGNIDGNGRSYAAELIPAAISYKGAEFQLVEPTKANSLRCNGQKIKLPEGNWNKVRLLAAATKHDTRAVVKVAGESQEIYVPYYGGFVAQWGHTGHTEGFMKNADIAFVGTHTHSAKENKDAPYEFTYMFSVDVNIPAGVKEFTLPVNKAILVFAATAIADDVNTLTPACNILGIDLPEPEMPAVEEGFVNLLSSRLLTGFSGRTSASEKAELATDDNSTTKWCDTSTAPVKFIEYDLKEEKDIRGWYVLHAGQESMSYVTRDFALQVKDSENADWRTVDEVAGNSENETARTLATPLKARFVRLAISKADQSGNNVARIYEFSVY